MSKRCVGCVHSRAEYPMILDMVPWFGDSEDLTSPLLKETFFTTLSSHYWKRVAYAQQWGSVSAILWGLCERAEWSKGFLVSVGYVLRKLWLQRRVQKLWIHFFFQYKRNTNGIDGQGLSNTGRSIPEKGMVRNKFLSRTVRTSITG